MMPKRFWDHPDGLIFRTEPRDGKPSVAIENGPVAERTLSGMRQAVSAMARADNT